MSLVAAKTLLATDEHRSTQMGNQTFVLCVVRLRDEPILDSDLHCDEVQILTEYKMALQQHSAQYFDLGRRSFARRAPVQGGSASYWK
jgi:hypothetical protein